MRYWIPRSIEINLLDWSSSRDFTLHRAHFNLVTKAYGPLAVAKFYLHGVLQCDSNFGIHCFINHQTQTVDQRSEIMARNIFMFS